MTNPTAPRWIPAAEKEGGLVFGDVVKLPDSPTEYAVLGHDGDPAFDIYVVAEKDSHPHDALLSADLTDLLVRIDPLPESTDAALLGRDDLMVWDYDNEETPISTSTSVKEAAEDWGGNYMGSPGEVVIARLLVAKPLPDQHCIIVFDKDGRGKMHSRHSSRDEAEAVGESLNPHPHGGR